MKTISILFVISFIAVQNVYSQSSTEIYISGNYNFFSMSDLKNFQGEILSDYTSKGIPVAVSESFPGYFGFRGTVLFPLSRANIHSTKMGAFINYQTTGGRVDYSDYSGELKIDILLHSISAGGIFSFWLKDISDFTLSADLRLMLVFSGMDFNNLLRIGNQKQVLEYQFNSMGFAIEPGLRCSTTVSRFIFGASVSYLINFPSALEMNEGSGATLKHIDGNNVLIDWSGFKFGLTGGITF